MVTWAERVMTGVSLLFAWFSSCCSLKISSLSTTLLALFGLSEKVYSNQRSLYPMHTDRLYP